MMGTVPFYATNKNMSLTTSPGNWNCNAMEKKHIAKIKQGNYYSTGSKLHYISGHILASC